MSHSTNVVSAFGATADVADVDATLTDELTDTCVSLSDHEKTWGFTTNCPSKVNATAMLTFRDECDAKVEVYIVDRQVSSLDREKK